MAKQKWPGKFIIGLTGNIATGKSVVRKMLEHVGAFGIDADALSNRAIQQGAPGYQAVVDAFGSFILYASGDINRAKLGRLVFSDEEALTQLEAIIHPLVRQAVEVLIQRSRAQVVVVEAIKLLESPLRQFCDAIWVTTADEAKQLERLRKHRSMDTDTARQRMDAQSPQEEKAALADVVIHNNGSIESTWEQVKAAWKLQFPDSEGDTVATSIHPISETKQNAAKPTRKWTLTRARPRQAAMIAEFIRQYGGYRNPTQQEILESFASRAFLLLQNEEGIRALLGWRVENLVARVDQIVCAEGEDQNEMLAYLIEEVEDASSELQCEILLIFLNPNEPYDQVLTLMGYERRNPTQLNVAVWREAALESFEDNQTMYFKTLRADRILRPL